MKHSRWALLVVGEVLAQEPVETSISAKLPATSATPASEETARLGIDAGLGAYGEDGMATLHLSLLAKDDSWTALLDPRLRLRTVDRGTQDSTIRREDWDEPSDFAHALRELSVRQPIGADGRWELRAGELAELSLGHGSLVREYTNALDPDHLRAGVYAFIDDPWFGLEAMVDNYVGPRLVAGRMSVHPLDERFTVGATAAFDLYAPDEIRLQEGGARSMDGARNLEAYYSTLAMAGGDAEVRIADDGVAVTPYVDANALVGLGAGVHAGALVEVAPQTTRLTLRGEYRFGSDGYLPGYADTFYDLSRLQFQLAQPGSDEELATQRAAADAGGFGGHGFQAEMGMFMRKLRLGAGFSRRPGPEGNLMTLRMDIPAGRAAMLTARYLHRGIGQVPGANGAAVVAGLRVMLASSIYATADYAHLLRLDDAGVYRPIHIATAGLGVTAGF